MKPLPTQFRPGRLHKAQKTVWRSAARFRVFVGGRRVGKTDLGLVEGVNRCARKPNQVAWWTSPIRDQARRVCRSIRPALLASGHIRDDDGTQDRLEFLNGSRLEFVTAKAGTHLRGEGLDFLILDEAQDLAPEIWQEILSPALTDKKGSALFLGTPSRIGTWWHATYTKGLGVNASYKSFTAPTSASPLIDPAEIERARLDLPDITFQREYLAQFTEAGEYSVFENLRVDDTLHLRKLGRASRSYCTGIDLARTTDFTVALSLLVPLDDSGPAQVEGAWRAKGWNWAEQHEVLSSHLRLFPGAAIIDATGVGDPVAERLRPFANRLHPVTFTLDLKDQLIRNLRVALSLDQIALPANFPPLLDELRAYEGHELAIGTKYSAPSGQHDDCVIALALAWHGLRLFHKDQRPGAAPSFGRRGAFFNP